MLKAAVILILAAITGPVSCASVTPRPTVNTTVGGNVTLPCLYEMPVSMADLFIQWTFYSAKTTSFKSVYIYNKGQPYTAPAYKGRLEFANSTGNASVTISNMQPWETGLYYCEVVDASLKFPPPAPVQKSVSVNVFAPPSRPLCSFGRDHQQVELGHLVTLSCLSEIGLPNPTYDWAMLSGDTVKTVKDASMPRNGILVIGNLSKLEEGVYQCTASNFLGNSTCHIDLTTKHSEAGVVIGALIAAIVAAGLIAVVVWVLASKEKKKRKEEKAREMQVVTQKQPPTAEYAAVPSQEHVPLATVPPSQAPNETNVYATPEEAQEAGNEAARESGDHHVA